MMVKRRSSARWSVHPGEILQYEFLKPMNISGYRLAKALGINAQRVSDVTLKKTSLSAEMAVMLAKFFGTTPEFWMNLQAAHKLAQARRSLKKKLERIKPVKETAV
jgi:antitoxin HigA-1